MSISQIVIIIFIVLETSNIMILYFKPEMKQGNGLGVFKAYEKSKSDKEVHLLIKYLANWVAGTKLIFIMLLLVILFNTTESTKIYTLVVLILSILSFFWRMFPIIRSMDKENQLTVKGYSKTLGLMIAMFILGFLSALIVSLI